jgi:hypothetical protein
VPTAPILPDERFLIRCQLGFDYLEDYRKAVTAVTPEDPPLGGRQTLERVIG